MNEEQPLAEERNQTEALKRRQMLKLGAYAAYTAPLMLAMATEARAQGTSGTGGCDFTDPDCEF